MGWHAAASGPPIVTARHASAPELPKLLTIMGSGEIAPTMVKVHRAVLDRLGPPPVPAVLLDTPYAFQENRTELSNKVKRYFAESLHTDIAVAGGEDAFEGDAGADARDISEDPLASERLVGSVRRAAYVFAGPGSPTYALRNWAPTIVPSLLREKLHHGGAVTFSSAAALTLGSRTVPVYEIYKVGEEPHWLEGLDLLTEFGLNASVIPHFNNAEGGTHDTRFCYLGERRLAKLESELPEGGFVLGIDEHTAVTFDFDSRAVSIVGLGVMTVRVSGRARSFSAGETLSIDKVAAVADELRSDGARRESGSGSGSVGSEAVESEGYDGEIATDRLGVETEASQSRSGAYEDSPLIAIVREQEAAFATALSDRDLERAVAAVLALEAQITDWSTDIPFGDAMDRARASLRSLVLELGKVAETGARDPRSVFGPYVEFLLELRAGARSEKRFEESDLIRDRLVELGVEVRDTPEGTDWVLG